MTDRFGALHVVLEKDIREDDAEGLMDALRCFRGVLSVSGEVADINLHIATERVQQEVETRIIKALRDR